MNPISDFMREQAAAHREAAAKRPDDPRPLNSAAALEALADYADAGAQEGAFHMRYLLEHHVADGRFAWPKGQSGRAILLFGYDSPVGGEAHLEQFLMDLCDLVRSDAARHIGSNERDFERADAEQIAARHGLSAERVHHALDAGRRYARLWVVGIPDWHEIDPAARAELEGLDGVIVARAPRKGYDGPPPLLVKNVPADDEADARELVAKIVAIEPGALGVLASSRVF
ncbi:MAG: hypothetical protein QOE11_2882 [Solirubrobacteraceae bacterium]|jgi:hypothetical protein|nr:hypothetical protein [Solirubrobacteraceae bacterium]